MFSRTIYFNIIIWTIINLLSIHIELLLYQYGGKIKFTLNFNITLYHDEIFI